MSLEKNIKLLKWHSFFNDFSLWAPLAIIYFSKISGSYTLGLSIFSIAMISSAFFELPTGFISDRYGRVKTLIFGSVAFLLSGIFYAIGINYWFLFIGAIFSGLGRSFYSGNNDALLYDNLAESGKSDDFAEYNGKISSMSQIALAIAGLFGGVIAYFSFSVLMWLSIIPSLVCFIIAIKLTETKIISSQPENIFNHIGIAYKNFFSNIRLRLINFSDIINFGLNEPGYQFRAAFVTTLWPVWAIGISNILSNIGSGLSFHFSGKIIKKFSPLNILISKLFINKIISLTGLLMANIFSPIFLTLNSLFYGVGQVAKNKLLQDEFTSEQRATMGSLNSLMGSVLFVIFATILGLLADKFGPRNALIVQSIMGIPTLYFYFALKKNIKNEAK